MLILTAGSAARMVPTAAILTCYRDVIPGSGYSDFIGLETSDAHEPCCAPMRLVRVSAYLVYSRGSGSRLDALQGEVPLPKVPECTCRSLPTGAFLSDGDSDVSASHAVTGTYSISASCLDALSGGRTASVTPHVHSSGFDDQVLLLRRHPLTLPS